MDSLTQVTLGAAVGEAILGRQLGNRAIVWGAFFGNLPDMDIVFAPLMDSIQFIVHHREVSHSLFAIALAAPAFSWIFARWYQNAIGYWQWLTFFSLVLLTHILLDCCTSYGTQIFWPFYATRVAWNNIFIIDPLYTTPLLAAVGTCFFLRRASRLRRRLNYAGLILSTGYLALTFAGKYHVQEVYAASLARQNIDTRRFMTCPTPLNTMLWYGVAEVDGGYHIGFYSIFDSSDEIRFQYVPRQGELLTEVNGIDGVDRLIWFADGYYCVRPHSRGVLLHIMKFGTLNLENEQEQYPFSYLIVPDVAAGAIIEPYRAPHNVNMQQLASRLWNRIRGI